MKVTYSPQALRQLDSIFAYIARDNPKAAAAVVDHIEATAKLIGRFPSMGRPTDEPDVRIRVITRYPYLLVYKILADREEIRIMRVFHQAQKRD
jgi:addiction module RelE/StbE family toxin